MSAPLGGVASERTLFLGPSVPNHVKTLCKYLPTIKMPIYRALLQLAVDDLEGKEINPEAYESIKSSSNADDNIDFIYSGLYILLRSALRVPETMLKQEVFKEDLHELKIPEDYAVDLVNIVYSPRRSSINANAIKNAPHLPRLEKLRWRVDVAISSSSLNRVLEPSVLLEMAVSDGKKETFEVHPTQFHQLRYSVAMLLKEMEALEKKNVLKL